MSTIPCATLEEMYSDGIVEIDGRVHHFPELPLPPAYAEALFATARDLGPDQAIEVGCATGTSALAVLTALEENGSGRLVSVDPFQSTKWHDIGRTLVERAGLDHRHEIIERFDYLALPDLLERGNRFQLAYIDGMHTFDYTLLDFFFVDKMLDVGGMVAFNDCGWPAVHRVLRYLVTHRLYEEVSVGLPCDYRGRNFTSRLWKRLRRRSNADRYFRKTGTWEPPTSFHARF